MSEHTTVLVNTQVEHLEKWLKFMLGTAYNDDKVPGHVSEIEKIPADEHHPQTTFWVEVTIPRGRQGVPHPMALTISLLQIRQDTVRLELCAEEHVALPWYERLIGDLAQDFELAAHSNRSEAAAVSGESERATERRFTLRTTWPEYQDWVNATRRTRMQRQAGCFQFCILKPERWQPAGFRQGDSYAEPSAVVDLKSQPDGNNLRVTARLVEYPGIVGDFGNAQGLLDEFVQESILQFDGWEEHDASSDTGGPAADSTPCGGTSQGRVRSHGIDAPRLNVEDIESFAKVRDVSAAAVSHLLSDGGYLDQPEDVIQTALETILDVPFHKKDWGGETNDLYTANVVVHGSRIPTAFLLKGHGLKGKTLQIKDCGHNGDQIVRLFDSPAQLFVVQSVGEVSESVVKDVAGKVDLLRSRGGLAWYCIMNGQDTARVLRAYGKL